MSGFAAMVHKRDIPPNETLIREGEVAGNLFRLRGLFSGWPRGRRFFHRGSGGMLGDMSLLTEKAASASVT